MKLTEAAALEDWLDFQAEMSEICMDVLKDLLPPKYIYRKKREAAKIRRTVKPKG